MCSFYNSYIAWRHCQRGTTFISDDSRLFKHSRFIFSFPLVRKIHTPRELRLEALIKESMGSLPTNWAFLYDVLGICAVAMQCQWIVDQLHCIMWGTPGDTRRNVDFNWRENRHQTNTCRSLSRCSLDFQCSFWILVNALIVVTQ